MTRDHVDDPSADEPVDDAASGPKHRLNRRNFVGAAAAAGAAIVWTNRFPFAGAAIGQAIDPLASPTGPTGAVSPTGATGTVPTGSTGSTGASGALATTGTDTQRLGALGVVSVAAGGAIVWLRRRGADTTPESLDD